ncbi:GNAT family N-acetyltransferase [Maribacter sp. X9]|uniref:GNAT family N-acetyltransferase n=1 Tax=Maribacter sp. X9 TaxID=3402159 RepID=UPI003AF33668
MELFFDMVRIKRITAAQIDDVVNLFNDYRIFYTMESDLDAAKLFLSDRLHKNESIVFAAYSEGIAVGFTQLYYTFSSVTLERYLILNDLYVAKSHRNKSIGKHLLVTAQDYCKMNGFKGLALETAIDNPAQKLYEQLGWVKDYHCFHYFWAAN